MDNPKMVSEREAVMRERAAFELGFTSHRFYDGNFEDRIGAMDAPEGPERVALDALLAKRYPLPPLSLGVYAGREYRLRDGVLEYQTRAHSPVLGPPTDERPRWDRASLQPNDIRELAAELVDAD